jgi:hypothetical protein
VARWSGQQWKAFGGSAENLAFLVGEGATTGTGDQDVPFVPAQALRWWPAQEIDKDRM